MSDRCRTLLLPGLSALFVLASVVSPASPPVGHRVFNLGCEACHTTTSWKDVKKEVNFDHGQTGFPLTGQHSHLPCQACHKGANFAAAEGRCSTCHRDIHRGEVGDACERCHDSGGWTPSQRLMKHQETRFPLVGAHALTDCVTCHVNQQRGEYAGLRTDCAGCHLREFEMAKTPTHAAAKSVVCETCHSVTSTSWMSSSFAHPASFPLDGAHRTASCASCHQSGYTNTPATCDACHDAVFRQAKNPDHVASGFPLTCKDCHTTSAWIPSTFNHEQYFPISRGAHNLSCSSCHLTPSDMKVFSCINCHAHDQTSMDRAHRNRRGYVYESNACYTCHPRGSSEGGGD